MSDRKALVAPTRRRRRGRHDAAVAAGKAKLATTGRIADAMADFEAAEEILCEDAPAIPSAAGSDGLPTGGTSAESTPTGMASSDTH